MLQLEVDLLVVVKDKNGRVWPGCRQGRLWVLSGRWEAGKETRAWIQELGHDSRRMRGRDPRAVGGPAWTWRSRNHKGATDPLGFLGGEIITCEDRGETMFSLSRWRSRSQADPTVWQSALLPGRGQLGPVTFLCPQGLAP